MLLIYFIYGLAFFSMGLIMALESQRSPLLMETQALRPLAAFGLLHGAYEWLEMFVLAGARELFPIPSVVFEELRLLLLVSSFMFLAIFGVRELRLSRKEVPGDLQACTILAGFYLLLLLGAGLAGRTDFPVWLSEADILARYALAVPGSFLAAAALHHRARRVRAEERLILSRSFHWAGAGFLMYGISQIFVPPSELLPARLLNAETFWQTTGLPVQLVRAVIAIIPTLGLVKAIQIINLERQEQLLAAQASRLEAMKVVQQEMLKRENLRRQLLRQMVNAQEEERKRIARELHDETAQILTAANLNLAALKNVMPNQRQAGELVGRLQSHCQQMSRNLKRLVHDLRPAQLDDLGLLPALRFLVDKKRQDLGLDVVLELHGRQRKLNSFVETVVYRVTQEALTNVARHAGTHKAVVHLDLQPSHLFLEIGDDGKGLDPGRLEDSGQGLGLAGMRERVESMGGEFRILSSPGGGTRIQATIGI